MEVYRTKDNTVAKYVHDDGSETSIKTTPKGKGYGKVLNKYNIFISTSVGCQVGCDFCYLTIKKCPFINLSENSIIENVINALLEELEHRPELVKMYTKLSWMGMGDAVVDITKMAFVTEEIIKFLRINKLSAGIDGVDVSTTFPVIRNNTFSSIISFNSIIKDVSILNPIRMYSASNSPLRLFYSLHSAVEATRRSLIPVGANISEALKVVDKVYLNGITAIIHHMFFDGINDTPHELSKLHELLVTLNGMELRILRFNSCSGIDYTESADFDYIISTLYSRYRNVKVQMSPGSEVKAACGQFLLSRILK